MTKTDPSPSVSIACDSQLGRRSRRSSVASAACRTARGRARRVQDREQHGDRVLERTARDPAGLITGAQRDVPVGDAFERRPLHVGDRDRRGPRVAVAFERSDGFGRRPARRDRDHDRLSAAGGPERRGCALDDHISSRRAHHRGDRQRGEPGRPQADEDDPADRLDRALLLEERREVAKRRGLPLEITDERLGVGRPGHAVSVQARTAGSAASGTPTHPGWNRPA